MNLSSVLYHRKEYMTYAHDEIQPSTEHWGQVN